MGCDAYADSAGKFSIIIRSYDDNHNPIKTWIFNGSGLEPNERLSVEWLEGTER